jgi:hypothetical protein
VFCTQNNKKTVVAQKKSWNGKPNILFTKRTRKNEIIETKQEIRKAIKNHHTKLLID